VRKRRRKRDKVYARERERKKMCKGEKGNVSREEGEIRIK